MWMFVNIVDIDISLLDMIARHACGLFANIECVVALFFGRAKRWIVLHLIR
jgi:hypothetical protein